VQGFLLDHRDKAKEAVKNADNLVIEAMKARSMEMERKERERREKVSDWPRKPNHR
jgi:hypothetical protein